MGLMERACGSHRFSEEFARNERKLARIAKEKSEMNGTLRAIMKDRKKADQLVRDVEKSGQLIEREVRLETLVFAARHLSLDVDARELKAKAKRLKKDTRAKEREIERLSGLILQKKAEMNGALTRKRLCSC